VNRRTQIFKLSKAAEKAWADYTAALNAKGMTGAGEPLIRPCSA